ncbi:hypothetical protein J4E93_001975 [Alternaria ventricosa]|uniref:uncharacterized protein n=1 Tax=Alternaria ventricosa TaxID=1187951 RepID=UPI0020C294B2|nr:uncharacterized protein J4E93_001975 [Alternaria ventricosa]KAI4651779.1 hypothetical protein J4E93_001975 [Alternaria ventricosa]
MNPRWTTKIYVIIDIGSFVCQIMGSAMQASGDPDGVKTGTTVVIAGLGTQLVAFGFFILMAVVFHRRLNNEPTSTSRRTHVKWRRYMWALYSVSVLVVVRSIFRLAEFVEGPEITKLRDLSENIASIIVSKQSKDLSKAGITDVYVMSRNLNTTAVNGTAASGPAYLRIFVHIDYQSITVVKAKIGNGKNAIGALIDEVDKVIESLMEES